MALGPLSSDEGAAVFMSHCLNASVEEARDVATLFGCNLRIIELLGTAVADGRLLMAQVDRRCRCLIPVAHQARAGCGRCGSLLLIKPALQIPDP